ncbi:MAG: hypothetical protein DCC71_17595 [Proteobacteria bacterium]|nr:MAG: hypothetical protein DCC71_17595 [Pseudomonadota bacterium]
MMLLRSRRPFAVLALALCAPLAASAAGTVGVGTPESCTEAALDAALAGGGVVDFDCGALPVVIEITAAKTIADVETTLDGDGVVTLAAVADVGLFTVASTGTLTLRDLTLQDGRGAQGGAIANAGGLAIFDCVLRDNAAFPAGDGGAIHNTGTLVVSRTVLDDNAATRGGAIANAGVGPLLVEDSHFVGNAASDRGGALFTNANNLATASRSLFEGNSATDGGAIAVGSASLAVTVRNSTFTQNAADDRGAALYAEGPLTVRNATLASNRVGGDGDGGALWRSGGAVRIGNSILAGTTAIFASDPFAECGGSGITSDGHNVVEDASCGFAAAGDLADTDPALLLLADNGGPTRTLLPVVNEVSVSPAVDAGDPALCDALDQRGAPRPRDGDGDGEAICDVGAVEVPEPAAAAGALAAIAALAARARHGCV